MGKKNIFSNVFLCLIKNGPIVLGSNKTYLGAPIDSNMEHDEIWYTCTYFTKSFLSSLVDSFISFSTSLIPSLKLFTPLPKPFINSGIYFPPNNNSNANAIISNSPLPKFRNNKWFIKFNF